jgi:hypothetical protein
VWERLRQNRVRQLLLGAGYWGRGDFAVTPGNSPQFTHTEPYPRQQHWLRRLHVELGGRLRIRCKGRHCRWEVRGWIPMRTLVGAVDRWRPLPPRWAPQLPALVQALELLGRHQYKIPRRRSFSIRYRLRKRLSPSVRPVVERRPRRPTPSVLRPIPPPTGTAPALGELQRRSRTFGYLDRAGWTGGRVHHSVDRGRLRLSINAAPVRRRWLRLLHRRLGGEYHRYVPALYRW